MGRVHARGRKIRNRQINAERHAAREIADGVGTVVIENLHPKPTTAKGGRRKKAMNREMRYGRIGALLARIRLTAENAGVRAVKADPRGTSITCVECGHADRDSRRSRSVFICVRCGHGADADINAARNLPARRQDMSSKGPSAPSRSTPGLSGNGRIGGDPGKPAKSAREPGAGGHAGGPEKALPRMPLGGRRRQLASPLRISISGGRELILPGSHTPPIRAQLPPGRPCRAHVPGTPAWGRGGTNQCQAASCQESRQHYRGYRGRYGSTTS